MIRCRSMAATACLTAAVGLHAAAQVPPAPAPTPPPEPPREMRAVWIASIGNMDWPSRPGLTTSEQQRELLAILDHAAATGLNAVILQVRPVADAMYESALEPWSQFLTGRQGRAPEPRWDPLAFAISEAHRRGLELHAWFNPYRARRLRDGGEAARTHVTRAHPSLVLRYGQFLWMDPGEPEVRARSLRVILDVVRRYDVDAVHIDDYFYPYPENDAQGRRVEFPDSGTYARYRRGGGALSRDDWRRRNVDLFVEELYRAVRRTKPHVRVGISPFGIWRPGHPEPIRGLDAFASIYADARKWVRQGWADYFAPQLYWPVEAPQQSFPLLLDWWIDQNTPGRHIWPGLGTYRIPERRDVRYTPDEIARKIDIVRSRAGATGHVHFNMSTLLANPDTLVERLRQVYAEPALVPASPWLGGRAPGRPSISITTDTATGELYVHAAPARGENAWLWVMQTWSGGAWRTEIVPGAVRRHRLTGFDLATDAVAVSAVDRVGNRSVAVVVRASDSEH